MKITKILALLLIVLILCGTFAGCKNKNEEESELLFIRL